jgi:hypothetical protein
MHEQFPLKNQSPFITGIAGKFNMAIFLENPHPVALYQRAGFDPQDSGGIFFYSGLWYPVLREKQPIIK